MKSRRFAPVIYITRGMAAGGGVEKLEKEKENVGGFWKMKYKLYGLYSGDELVYVGKIEDTAQAYCEEFNLHLDILENGG